MRISFLRRSMMLSAILGVFCLSGCRTFSPNSLTVLHTNDIHAAYGGLTSTQRPCYAAQCENGQGGAVRLKQAIDTIRTSTPNTVLVDAGDQFQGTLFYTQYREKPTAAVLNALSYDAMTPGNHEFDHGCDPLIELGKKLTNTQLLGANLIIDTPEAAKIIHPWRIIERGNHKIGLIGIVTPETVHSSSPCAAAAFEDPQTALQHSVTELTASGIDIIIAVTHLGLGTDQQLAQTIDGIDVIVGGHTHSLLSNTDTSAEGTYPVVETAPSGQPVLIVTAQNNGIRLGRLDIDFDEKGIPIHWKGNPITLDGQPSEQLSSPLSPVDTQLSNTIETFSQPLTDLMTETIGQINSDIPAGHPIESMHNQPCRFTECLSGNLLTDGLLWKAAEWNVDIVLHNGGGIRAAFPSGTVSAGDILTVLPFDNLMVVGDISGNLLLSALEHGLSGLESKKGRFLQVAGMQYTFDPSQPIGKRLTSAALIHNNQTIPITTDQTYRIAISDYLAQGGDGFSMFKEIHWTSTGQSQSEIIREYFRTTSPLNPVVTQRIGH